MLVLTRRTDESLVISDEIIVTVLAIEGDKVKIGITAPRSVTILRKELWQALRDQEKIAEKLAAEAKTEPFDELRKFLASEAAGDGQPPEKKPD